MSEQRRTAQALGLAAYAAQKHRDTKRARDATIWFAADQGATVAEIVEATGTRASVVRRVLGRARRGG